MESASTAAAVGRTRCQKRDQLLALERAVVDGEPAAAAVLAHVQRNGLSPKRGWADLAQVRRRLTRRAADRTKNAAGERGLAVARLDRLYQRAVEGGELPTALAAEVEKCRLLGLYAINGT